MLKTKIPSYIAVLSAICGAFISYLVINYGLPVGQASASSKASTTFNTGQACPVKVARLDGYAYIKPYLFADRDCEPDKYASVKMDIMNLVNREQQAGTLASASVYLRDFAKNDWMVMNNKEMYHPGSLMKVPLLIAYMRMAETDPGLLDREFLFESGANVPMQTYTSQAIQPGHKYSVRTLFHYMIAYSDNNATLLLNQHVDVAWFKKVFTDLHIKEPDIHDKYYEISAFDYSKFLRVLYNATYLTINASEYATSLLGECNFKDGMVKQLPTGVKVAHKFGEWADQADHELHESGVIYLNNKPYMITVMTKGKNPAELARIISDISKLVYDKISADAISENASPLAFK